MQFLIPWVESLGIPDFRIGASARAPRGANRWNEISRARSWSWRWIPLCLVVEREWAKSQTPLFKGQAMVHTQPWNLPKISLFRKSCSKASHFILNTRATISTVWSGKTIWEVVPFYFFFGLYNAVVITRAALSWVWSYLRSCRDGHAILKQSLHVTRTTPITEGKNDTFSEISECWAGR